MKCRLNLRIVGLIPILAASSILGTLSCGGGASGGSQGPPPPPSNNFSLAVTPGSQSVAGGTTSYVMLSATWTNGSSSQISVQASGLPPGISVAPTTIALVPGAPQQIGISAAPNVAAGAQTITFTGTSGSLTQTTQLSLSLTPFTGLPTRTRFLRTDATTVYGEWINQHWIVYHTGTNRYFVTDPSTNQIIVVDARSKTMIGNILVPQAFGIDQSPDGSILYVGTLIGDVYTVDPVGMAVIQRYMASQIGPTGFYAYTALPLADGQLALVGGPSYPSAPFGIEGSTTLAIWNPADNSITEYGANLYQQSLPMPCDPENVGTIGAFILSADRTTIIFAINEVLCEYDPGTGTWTSSDAPLSAVSDNHITATPDGNYLILPNNLQTPGVADVFDAQTLALVSQFSVLGDTSSNSGFFVSSDSSTLYVPSDGESIIYAYNLASQQLVGWMPDIYVEPDFVGEAFADGPFDTPYFLATDGTGVFAGPLGEGLGFVDVSTLLTGPVGTQFGETAQSPNPATGPIAGGTATQWTDEILLVPLTSVFFGTQSATSISATETTADIINFGATSPPGSAGPADIYAFTTDGGMQLLPEAFSYGPTILEVTPNMATAEGGGTGYIYGYGFGPINTTSVPTDLQISVNGTSTQVLGFAPSAYDLVYPPFPLQSAAYLIPPGLTGSAVNVSVSTSAGSATASDALTYLTSIQQFPLPSSSLAEGIYDSYTGLYYFTDTNQIQVFSRTSGKWLSPISIPAPPGTTQRLWAIALSPDGSKLAVTDAMAAAIYVLNPSNPSSVATFPVTPEFGIVVNPSGVAISDSGMVYYTVYENQGVGGVQQFFKLNTNTGQVLNYGIDGSNTATDIYLRTLISTDNSRVFFNDLGYIFYIETATDAMVQANIDFPCCYLQLGNYDMALSSNQMQFEGTGYFYDFNLDAQSFYAQNDREVLNIQYVYGAKLSPDGVLFFQPSTNGIDVFDADLGDLLERISLPVALSSNYDALVADGTDSVLIAITGTGDGIAIVDLTSIKEPPASLKPAEHNHRAGRRLYDGTTRRAQQTYLPPRSHVVHYVTRALEPRTMNGK
jgi:hypothetical protein